MKCPNSGVSADGSAARDTKGNAWCPHCHRWRKVGKLGKFLAHTYPVGPRSTGRPPAKIG